MVVLITGAAGFIGSKVAERFISLGFKTVTIDNLSTGYKKNIPDECHFIEGNVFDRSTLEKINWTEISAVIHIAGQSSGEISFNDPLYDLDTNCRSTIMLLEFCKNYNIKNFIYTSTMSVYGDTDVIEETTPKNPKSFYGIGKSASEEYCKLYSTFGISVKCLRLFNVYGPGQNLENMAQGMVSIYLSMALKHKKITVKGSATRYRDFIYIDDVVTAFEKVFSKTDKYLIVDVATGCSTTVREILSCITTKLNYEINIDFIGSTPGDIHGIEVNNNSMLQLVGFNHKFVDISDGISRMIDWASRYYE
jgi:UDP-glucose 4-epimerase